jgi:hypothetical protein
MKIQKVLLLIMLLISTFTKAQLENVIVEKYYITTPTDSIEFKLAGGAVIESGTTTYRIYIDLLPGNKLIKIYGDANHPLKFSSTTNFYNNVDGVSFANNFNNLNAHKNLTYALDTWLTIGQTTKLFGGKTNYGILKSQDRNGTNILISDAALTNSTIPIPLTQSDGMDTIALPIPTNWLNAGFITPSGGDSTIFGSTKIISQFISNSATLLNSGVRGVIADSNQVLIAQLTTKGNLEFEINIEVEELINGIPTNVKYVANDNVILPGEKYSPFLKYPGTCGCKDARYLEYSNVYRCNDPTACKNLIVFGCMDTMACNYDSKANYQIKSLCCYPGSCGGREISTVCPSVNRDNFEFDIRPNPTQDKVYLSTLPSKAREISYAIYDTFGTILLTKNLGSTTLVKNEEIDLSSFNSGLYLIKINYENTFKSRFFIKN